MQVSSILVAEVKPGHSPDRLVFACRSRDDRHRLLSLLRAARRGVRLSGTAEGVVVDALEADAFHGALLSVSLSWSPEAERIVANRRKAKLEHQRLREVITRIVSGGKPVAAQFLGDDPGLITLDAHQWVNVACMTLNESFGLCVFDEQGAGKTVTTIYAYDVLVARDMANFMLIVAPKSMVPEWPSDFSRFLGDRYDVRVVSGKRAEKRRTMTSDADVLVTNFETAVSMEAELRSVLNRHRDRAILVVDESFYAKNLDAKRTVALRRLREWCGRAFVLCGTPAPNSPHDLIQQFNLVDYGLTFNNADVPEDCDLARPVVRRLINERGLYVRHQKRVVLPDLPSKAFNRLFVPLQPQQAKLYESALHNLLIDLRNVDDATFHKEIASFLARRSALLQICSNPAAVGAGYSETPAKLLAIDGLLADAIEARREKVIVWSFYTGSVEAIVSRYRQYNPVRYDGTVSDVAERRAAVKRFQTDDETMLFVGNPAAAGAGLTLHRARFAIYESMSNQAAHYLQSLDRIHRRGQTRNVEYAILLCENTIEEEEYSRLIHKEQSAADLLGDRTNTPVTRRTMLAEIVAAERRFLNRMER